MADKDVNIHVKTPGAKQSKQNLDQLGKSAKKVGDKTKQGARTGADGMNKLSAETGKTTGRFAKLKSSMISWAAGLVGVAAAIRAVTTLIRIQKDALIEHARIAAEQQKKMLALQAMGTFFEEHPEARKEAAAYAEFGRRPFPEVAEAWYGLESKGAGLTKEQKRGIMRESLELGRLEPESDLKSIVEVFSLYAKETGQKDINLVQNILKATLSKAGASLSELAQQFTKFLPVGVGGGLTGAETAGIWAYATTRTGAPEQATVGMRNIFAALQGRGTPESKELLEQLGVTSDMGFFEQLGRLASQKKAGRFGVPEAELIAGRENFSLLLSMLTDPKAMMETIGDVTGKARPDIDITKAKLDEIMGTDEVARLEEDRRLFNIKIENLKATDVESLRKTNAIRAWEVFQREAGMSEVDIALMRKMMELGAYVGVGSETMLEDLRKQQLKFNMEPAAETFGRQQQPVVIYDNSIKYYPRTGDPESGPRFSQE